MNPNYTTINVEVEKGETNSVLNFYREMIRLRRSKRVLVFGSYEDIWGDHPKVYAYRRADESGQAVVILNFSNEEADFEIPSNIVLKQKLVSNVTQAKTSLSGNVHLLPWQSLIFQ